MESCALALALGVFGGIALGEGAAVSHVAGVPYGGSVSRAVGISQGVGVSQGGGASAVRRASQRGPTLPPAKPGGVPGGRRYRGGGVASIIRLRGLSL